MTVQELIKALGELDPTLPIVIVGLSRIARISGVYYEAEWDAVEIELEGN
jgi:hypothetical protein